MLNSVSGIRKEVVRWEDALRVEDSLMGNGLPSTSRNMSRVTDILRAAEAMAHELVDSKDEDE
jgi:hypothetical protein